MHSIFEYWHFVLTVATEYYADQCYIIFEVNICVFRYVLFGRGLGENRLEWNGINEINGKKWRSEGNFGKKMSECKLAIIEIVKKNVYGEKWSIPS